LLQTTSALLDELENKYIKAADAHRLLWVQLSAVLQTTSALLDVLENKYIKAAGHGEGGCSNSVGAGHSGGGHSTSSSISLQQVMLRGVSLPRRGGRLAGTL
jgi:hypothetical protein